MDSKYNPKKGLKALKEGDFNSMSQKHLPDGSIAILINNRKTGVTYQFKVKNLYRKGEKALEYKCPFTITQE